MRTLSLRAIIGCGFVTFGLAAGAALAQDTAGPAFPLNYIPQARAEAAALPPDDTTRILGGEIAARGAWPWQVALVRAGADPFQGQFCGGSIIAGFWVLTAAHCVYDEAPDRSLSAASPAEIEILVGTNVLSGRDGQRIGVAGIFPHPGYDPRLIDNDIALIRLAARPTDPDVAFIRLASLEVEPTFAPVGGRAIVTGWGRLQNGRFPDELMQVATVLLDAADCNQAAVGNATPKPGVVITGPITENMICTLVSEGKGSCNGDSGGPMVVALPDNSFMQIGIVSWGYSAENEAGCALDAAFEAYTRVAQYRDWIVATVSAN